MSFALTSQGIGEGVPDGTLLIADQEVNVGDLVTVAGQRFSDVHRHRTDVSQA